MRLLAKVLIRIPNQATDTLPAMPTRLKARMIATWRDGHVPPCLIRGKEPEINDQDRADEDFQEQE